jgi:hypothetical protein
MRGRASLAAVGVGMLVERGDYPLLYWEGEPSLRRGEGGVSRAPDEAQGRHER